MEIDTYEAIIAQGLIGEKEYFAVEYIIRRAKYSYKHFSEYTRIWVKNQYFGRFDEPEMLGVLYWLGEKLQHISKMNISEGKFDYANPKKIFRFLEKDMSEEQEFYSCRICTFPAYEYFTIYAVPNKDDYLFMWKLRKKYWREFPDCPKGIIHHQVSKDYVDRVLLAWIEITKMSRKTFSI